MEDKEALHICRKCRWSVEKGFWKSKSLWCTSPGILEIIKEDTTDRITGERVVTEHESIQCTVARGGRGL